MELLRELLPTAARVAVLVNPASAATTEATLRGVEPAARTTGLQIQVFNANTSLEIDAAFESMGRERPDALFVATTPFLNVRVSNWPNWLRSTGYPRYMGCVNMRKSAG